VGVLPVVGSGDGAGDVGTVSTGVTTGGGVGEGVSNSGGMGHNSSYTPLLLEPLLPFSAAEDDPLLDLPLNSAHTDSVEDSLLPDLEDSLLPDFVPEPCIAKSFSDLPLWVGSDSIAPSADPLLPDLEPEPDKISVHVYSTHASAQNVSTGLDSDFPDLPASTDDSFPDLPASTDDIDNPFPDLPEEGSWRSLFVKG
jgi:hypothetical protein